MRSLLVTIGLLSIFALPAFSGEKVIPGKNMIKFLKVIEQSGDGLWLENDHYKINGLSATIKKLGKRSFPENRLRFSLNESTGGYYFFAGKEKNSYLIYEELFNNKIPLAALNDFDKRNDYIQKIVITYMDCNLLTNSCLFRW